MANRYNRYETGQGRVSVGPAPKEPDWPAIFKDREKQKEAKKKKKIKVRKKDLTDQAKKRQRDVRPRGVPRNKAQM